MCVCMSWGGVYACIKNRLIYSQFRKSIWPVRLRCLCVSVWVSHIYVVICVLVLVSRVCDGGLFVCCCWIFIINYRYWNACVWCVCGVSEVSVWPVLFGSLFSLFVFFSIYYVVCHIKLCLVKLHFAVYSINVLRTRNAERAKWSIRTLHNL